MNIGIDARLLGGKMGGIHRYLSNIIKYLPEFDRNNKYTLFVYDNVPEQNKFYTCSIIRRSNLPRQIFEHYWLNIALPKQLQEQKIDLFFTPYVLVPMKKGSYKNVVVIHDAMTKVNKNFYSAYYRKYIEFFIPQAVKRSDAVITVSQSAKQDLIKYYNIPPVKVYSIHLWTDEKFCERNLNETEKEILQKKYNLPSKFILYVGNIENRKNVAGIIKISDILESKGRDIKIVLVGQPGFGFNKLHSEINYRRDRILYLNNVEEKLVPFLYNLATLFLFPSYYEGFGIPPLEAMKSGIPVLASNNSSIPEVVGDGGLLSNAEDYDDFAKNIIRLLNDEKLYADMKQKALIQAEKFTPQVLMPKFINVINSFSK
jgi:glycosyltransferase involved in cell wall biosynthesis